jgi:G:T-mismatch repair DNA endonuclease (very short patch repair protein)
MIADVLTRVGVEFIVNDRTVLNGRELDFWIPDSQLAIEVNGLYWHSEEMRSDKSAHLNKHQACLDLGIKLLQFWDCEVRDKRPIVESLIRHHVGATNTKVFGRSTKIIELTSKQSRPFLDANHIQGDVNASVRLGLTCQDNLVSVMTFSKARFGAHEWELTRFASLVNTSVVGGAAKLFKHFIKMYQPESIVTYADRRLFDGGVYTQLGFRHSHDVPKTYWYFDETEYWPHHRMRFQKKHLAKHFGEDKVDLTLTEHENMINNHWYRVWDCGQSVWTWTS